MDRFVIECLIQMANAVERVHGSLIAIIGYSDGVADTSSEVVSSQPTQSPPSSQNDETSFK